MKITAFQKERFQRGDFVVMSPFLWCVIKMSMMTRSVLVILALCAIAANALICVPARADDYLDYYEQGEFALRVQKWDRAIDLFSKSIKDNPNFFFAYHNRAIAYSKKGEYDKSINDLKKAVQLNPDYPDAYGLMGLVYEIKEDYASAFQVYQAALAREKRPQARRVLKKYMEDVQGKMGKKKAR
jgi:tetratricopeptide (TPR) repeat protein